MVFRPPHAGPVPREALDYLEAKSLKPGFSHLDVWRQEHTHAFTVAKIMEKDILADIHSSLAGALQKGIPFDEWKQAVKPLFDRSGWSAYGTERDAPRRLRTVYQTNMRVARAVGQWQRVQRTKQLRPYLMYQLGPAERHRPEHAVWDGLILPVDDPFWSYAYPPNGWGCKCGVIQLGPQEADRYGGPGETPALELIEWDNPHTGETEQVPRGIDPGWDYNPGAERQRKLEEVSR